MKKSLIALAVLGAFAGAASAQSSVTIYGFVDSALAKPVGTKDKQVVDGAQFGGGSRLGFRGVEDLGGGWKATFGIEHRFNVDTGQDKTQADSDAAVAAGKPATPVRFWNGYSTVGIVSPFGAVNLGRQYTPAFLMIQNQIDPFGGETVAQGRDTGMRFGSTSTVRVADSVRYDLSVGGFNLGVSIAESASNGGTAATGDDKPFSIAANYVAGPLWVGAGYENPANSDDKVWNVGARYNFGFMTLSGGYGRGTTPFATPATNSSSQSVAGWIVGATVPVGALDIKAMYATNKVDDNTAIVGLAGTGTTRKFGIGAHYNFSKRTKVYVDYGHVAGDASAIDPKNTKAIPDNPSGYDLGIKHVF